jgi:hypothetical protein
MKPSILFLHAGLGALVLAVGAFLLWDQGSAPAWALVCGLAAAAFLWWRGRTIGIIWAWTTMLLGMESMAWPIATMLRVRFSGAQPTEEEMGAILNAVLFGLFSSVFWVTFSLGLFKRQKEAEAPATAAPTPDTSPGHPRRSGKRK